MLYTFFTTIEMSNKPPVIRLVNDWSWILINFVPAVVIAIHETINFTLFTVILLLFKSKVVELVVCSVRTTLLFWSLQLNFQPFHADLKAVHGLYGGLRTDCVVEADKTWKNKIKQN